MITQNGLNLIELLSKTRYGDIMTYNSSSQPDSWKLLPLTTRDGTVIQCCNRAGSYYSYTDNGTTHYAVGVVNPIESSLKYIVPTRCLYSVSTGAPTNVINNTGGNYYYTQSYILIGTGTNAESLSDYDITNAQPYTTSTTAYTSPHWFYSCNWVAGSNDMIASFTNVTGQSVDISEIGLFWTNYNTTSTDKINKARNGVLWFRKVFTPVTVDDGDTINFRFKRNFDISIS